MCVEVFAESCLYYGEHKSWSYLEVLSDPPGAYVYGSDGSYWGKTEEDVPVVRYLWEDLCWYPSKRLWQWSYNDSPGGSNYYTITLKKRGYKATTQKFSVPLSKFHSYKGTLAELKANGELAMRPPQVPENTTKMVVVLDTE